MKKILLLTVLVALAFTAQSQTYKAFKVDIGIGYAIPAAGGGGTKAGATFTIQPHYRLTDAFAVGLRLEGAALGYQTYNTSNDVDVSLLISYSGTAEYYLMDGGFRPFIGAGAGFFNRAALNVGQGGSSVTVPSATKFGFFPTIGVEAGHFRLSADYNILENKGGYTAFKIGFFFGGGKK